MSRFSATAFAQCVLSTVILQSPDGRTIEYCANRVGVYSRPAQRDAHGPALSRIDTPVLSEDGAILRRFARDALVSLDSLSTDPRPRPDGDLDEPAFSDVRVIHAVTLRTPHATTLPLDEE